MVVDGNYIGWEDLINILPNRYDMLMINEITCVCGDSDGVGHYVSTTDSFWVNGHFPNNPIVPAFVLLECMAQTAGAIYLNYHEKLIGKKVYLAGVEKARFRKEVPCGFEILIRVHKKMRVENIVVFECNVLCGKENVGGANIFLGVENGNTKD